VDRKIVSGLRIDRRLAADAKTRTALARNVHAGWPVVLDATGQQVRKEILDAGDSGIFLRGSPDHQVNFWSQPMGSGDIQEIHKDPKLAAELRKTMLPRVAPDAPFGQWNRFVITLVAERVTVVLNGQKVIDAALLPGIPAHGPIGLQYHRDEIEVANLFIKEL
jgi:hypothetical protein